MTALLLLVVAAACVALVTVPIGTSYGLVAVLWVVFLSAGAALGAHFTRGVR